MWKAILLQAVGIMVVTVCAAVWVSPYLGGIILGSASFATGLDYERRTS